LESACVGNSVQGNRNFSLQGVVADVIAKKGFAITYPRVTTPGIEDGDSITFSLCAWSGEVPPAPGQIVLLEFVTRFEKGWRAGKASPISPRQK
jgi:hypothetical protein